MRLANLRNGRTKRVAALLSAGLHQIQLTNEEAKTRAEEFSALLKSFSITEEGWEKVRQFARRERIRRDASSKAT